MKKTLPIIYIILLIAAFGVVWKLSKKDLPQPVITNFEECAQAGYPILEIYPEQCRTPDGRLFTRSMNSGATEFGSSITLRLNEQAKFIDGLTVTLAEINDSRCKSGVVCIWAGELSSQFKLLGGNIKQDTQIRLGTITAKSATRDGYTFMLQGATENTSTITVTKVGGQVACTQEAKLCPDGSAVGRIGPNCEFAPCPVVNPNPVVGCTKDSDCPSSQYICQEIQGTGTACPSTDPSCVPTHTIIKGECKLKNGYGCSVDSDCASGNLCNKNICVSPVGRQCNGPSDTSCPEDFSCIQGCGPPVARQDDLPPPYYCQLKGYIRPCPICLAKHTLIETPQGAVAVEDLQIGAPVWTVTASGSRVVGVVKKNSKTAVLLDHKMVQLVLKDGRTLLVSPGHPTIDGLTVGDLAVGDIYDGSQVSSAERVSYGEGYTYDLLPSGETGFYWANGILLGSTLQ
jgi:hypothetical protein